jgi:hypothetical protein
MNLSHYQPLNPHMHQSNGEERIEAGGAALPADDQPAVLALEPRERPLGLKARDSLLNRSSARLSGLPHPFRDLGSDPASAESMTQVLSVIPFIGCHDLEPLARSARCTRTDVEGIQQWEHLGPLVAIGGRGARR